MLMGFEHVLYERDPSHAQSATHCHWASLMFKFLSRKRNNSILEESQLLVWECKLDFSEKEDLKLFEIK